MVINLLLFIFTAILASAKMNTFLALTITIFCAAEIFADYGGGGPGIRDNVIVLPASLSKAHPWTGFGNYYPEFVPKFFKAPRWLPGYDPTYSASWVPFAPKPRSQTYNGKGNNFVYASNGFINLDSSVPQGFGPPKESSISSGSFGGQINQYNTRRQSSGNRETFINSPHQTRNFQSQSPLNNQRFRPNTRLQHSQNYNNPSGFSPSFDPLNHNVLTNPLQLQVLDRNSNSRHPVLNEVKPITRAQNHVGFRHLSSTLHVGSRQPGAAPPEALGIAFKPEPKKINHQGGPRSTSSFQYTLNPSSNSAFANVPGQSFESVVSSFYTHSQ